MLKSNDCFWSELPFVTEDNITAALSEILSFETLLPSLLKLQKVDLIDVDGAILIYNHLIHLCDDSVEQAESLLVMSYFGHLSEENLSPLPKPSCSALDLLLIELSNFQLTRATEAKYLDSKWKKCSNMITSLSKESCVWLLKNWLISLTACDLSIMISLTFENRNETVSPGNILMLTPDLGINYSLKVVECDPKPPHKLRNRLQREKLLAKCCQENYF